MNNFESRYWSRKSRVKESLVSLALSTNDVTERSFVSRVDDARSLSLNTCRLSRGDVRSAHESAAYTLHIVHEDTGLSEFVRGDKGIEAMSCAQIVEHAAEG